MDYAQLRDAVRATAERVSEMLVDADAQQAVAGSEWTIGELGAHLVDAAARNCDMGGPGLSAPFERWTQEAMAEFNAERMAGEFAERDPAVLGPALVSGTAEVLEAYGPDGDRLVQWYWTEIRVEEALAIWLGELVIHGLDLARTRARAWPISRAEGVTVFEGIAAIAPDVVNVDTVRSTGDAVFHLHFRGGGPDYTFATSSDGTLTAAREKPASADLHISASPVAYLLVGYGRKSQWAAIARGQIMAWGKKPWLALRFADLFERP